MGAFDAQLMHLQFLLLLTAALAALWALLRDLVPPLFLWGAILAIASAPAVPKQLLTAYADLPLALLFGLGAAGAGRWLITNERWALALATLLFGAALLTKNEGALFVFAGFVGLLIASWPRWRPVVVAAAVDVAVLVPWRIYTSIYGLRSADYRLTDTFHPGRLHGHLGITRIAFRTLVRSLFDPYLWGLLIPLAAAVLLAAVLFDLRRLPLFVGVLTAFSLAGLCWIYVIARQPYVPYLAVTKDRVVASLVIAVAAIGPLLAAETLRTIRSPRPLAPWP
jgi:hypothetical protein